MALTIKQQIFADEYLKDSNRTQAAIRAGYSPKTAYSIGHENLKKPEIQEYISNRLTETAMSADEVLTRLASFARGSLKPFLVQRPEDDQVTLDLTTSLAQENIHIIKKITQKRTIRTGKDDEEIDEVTMSIELIDPKSALDTLARYHGLLVDRTESTVNNLDVDYSKLTVAQLTRIANGESVLKVILDGYIASSAGES